ncbi:MAG: TIGR02281 family clan AA aspartic protease [Hyphomicrobiales bacterium]
MRAIVCVFIFVAVVGVGLSRDFGKFIAKPGDHSAVAATAPARAAPSVSRQDTSGSYRTVKLESDRSGHFRVDARVDGRSIDFVVDTGASKIVMRESSAAKLGIFPRPSEYSGRTSTANGEARYAPVRLNRVEINGITVYDVDAAIMPDSALGVNLLGITFLSRIKFSHDRGRMVLEQ